VLKNLCLCHWLLCAHFGSRSKILRRGGAYRNVQLLDKSMDISKHFGCNQYRGEALKSSAKFIHIIKRLTGSGKPFRYWDWTQGLGNIQKKLNCVGLVTRRYCKYTLTVHGGTMHTIV
jgi:hypothetical protein